MMNILRSSYFKLTSFSSVSLIAHPIASVRDLAKEEAMTAVRGKERAFLLGRSRAETSKTFGGLTTIPLGWVA